MFKTYAKLMEMRGLRGYAVRTLVAAAVLVSIFGAANYAFVSMMMRHMETPLPRMFRNAFRIQTPASLADLQGFGHGYQGSSEFHFRFRASPEDLQELMSSRGWIPTTWDEVAEKFQVDQKDAKRLNPPWDPASCATKEVYSLRDLNSKDGNTFVLLDRATNTVYCAGYTF